MKQVLAVRRSQKRKPPLERNHEQERRGFFLPFFFFKLTKARHGAPHTTFADRRPPLLAPLSFISVRLCPFRAVKRRATRVQDPPLFSYLTGRWEKKEWGIKEFSISIDCC